ncbi:hypothetical protein GCM10027280_45320 [Micromonospora polyrhachis]|uniref:Tail assembly chaperone n=1 Tax=Micromonospora polyrhachis TaxID=1282883 RepID=A0A7W7WPQ6_9ACTN|nr:hypothetical protein [Micromonospora polyrhachis]MBB4958954.1 hypothetical protein [Micromonospora polyrhachis]
MSIKDKIKRARLAERDVPLCLDGALVAEIEAADRELQRLSQQPSADSLDGGGELREVAERIEALRSAMADSTVEFRLRAIPGNRWQAFLDQHPPRRDGDGNVVARDRALGVNIDEFFPALVRRCLVSPVLDDEDWTALFGSDEVDGALSDRQCDQLFDVAWAINRKEVDVPFSLAASRILRTSESE